MKNQEQKIILLVEDELVTAMVEMNLIKSFGYDVVTARSGEEAVQIATGNDKIALILMDVNLGAGLDGPEAARQILGKRNLPIVFLSSHTEKKYVERIKGIAGYGYIVKDSSDVVLHSSIEMAFNLFKAQEALRESEERYRAMFEQIAVGVTMIDLETKHFVYANPAICQMLGYSKEEFIRLNVADIHPKGALDHIIAEFKAQVHEKLLPAFPCRRKDGTIFYADITGTTATLQGKKLNIGFFVDITERKKVEEERKRIDQIKTNFISAVSHELRTPLSITKEGLSLVLDRIPGQINEKQEVIIAAVKNNMDRLSRIINAVLDISRIEAGQVELKMELVNIVDKAKEVVASFAPHAKNKGLELKTSFSSPAINIYLDPGKIIQIFTNLISNALKFTKEGHINIRIEELENEVECLVADTGIGIPENDLPLVFGKFQQFDRMAGPGEKGTGLGLAIVKNLVEMHRGKIRVESKRGGGTKFAFTFPKNKANDHSAQG